MKTYNKSNLPFRFVFFLKKKSEKEWEPIGGVGSEKEEPIRERNNRKFFYQRKSRNPSAAVFMGGGDYLLRGSRPQPENQREKALHLGFPFLGSCVWVLQCLKERQRQRLRNRFSYGVLFRSWRE